MKSGLGQERVGSSLWKGRGGSYCSGTDSRSNKVKGEWVLNITDSLGQQLQWAVDQNNITLLQKNTKKTSSSS